jgi:hypothetical protein
VDTKHAAHGATGAIGAVRSHDRRLFPAEGGVSSSSPVSGRSWHGEFPDDVESTCCVLSRGHTQVRRPNDAFDVLT